MARSALFSFLALSFLSLLSAAALAQGQTGPQSFDQYPSFFELTSTAPDGAHVVLRCGYASTNGQVALDPTFREISVLNEQRRTYSRIQRVDDAIIATSSDPTGAPGLLLELVKPDGSVTAKSCQTDPNNDTIGNCHTVPTFTFADQIKAGDAKIATQCGDLLTHSGSQINPARADVQKTEAFKATLRQKVSTLLAP